MPRNTKSKSKSTVAKTQTKTKTPATRDQRIISAVNELMRAHQQNAAVLSATQFRLIESALNSDPFKRRKLIRTAKTQRPKPAFDVTAPVLSAYVKNSANYQSLPADARNAISTLRDKLIALHDAENRVYKMHPRKLCTTILVLATDKSPKPPAPKKKREPKLVSIPTVPSTPETPAPASA